MQLWSFSCNNNVHGALSLATPQNFYRAWTELFCERSFAALAKCTFRFRFSRARNIVLYVLTLLRDEPINVFLLLGHSFCNHFGQFRFAIGYQCRSYFTLATTSRHKLWRIVCLVSVNRRNSWQNFVKLPCIATKLLNSTWLTLLIHLYCSALSSETSLEISECKTPQNTAED